MSDQRSRIEEARILIKQKEKGQNIRGEVKQSVQDINRASEVVDEPLSIIAEDAAEQRTLRGELANDFGAENTEHHALIEPLIADGRDMAQALASDASTERDHAGTVGAIDAGRFQRQIERQKQVYEESARALSDFSADHNAETDVNETELRDADGHTQAAVQKVTRGG